MRSRFTFSATFCWFIVLFRIALSVHERRPG